MFASLFRRPSRGRRAAAPRRFVPGLLQLEGRSLPSVTPLSLPEAAGDKADGAAPLDPGGQRVIPFKVTGAGFAPQGLPLTLNTPAPHNAIGQATHVGRYSGAGQFELLSFTSATTGTFRSAVPYPFTANNGDRLAFHYGRPDFGASEPGTFSLFPASGGTVYAVFVAEFTPVPSASTGRFRDVIGGSFVMTATTAPFVLGSTDSTAYSWEGEGSIIVARGGNAPAGFGGGAGGTDVSAGLALVSDEAPAESGVEVFARATPLQSAVDDRLAAATGWIDIGVSGPEAPAVIDAAGGQDEAASAAEFAIEVSIVKAS